MAFASVAQDHLISRSIGKMGDTVAGSQGLYGHFLWGPLIFLRTLHKTPSHPGRRTRPLTSTFRFRQLAASENPSFNKEKFLRALFP